MVTTDIQIRFSDLDSLRHVNNGAIVQYYDLGIADYVRNILRVKNEKEGAGVAKVHIEMNFFDSIESYNEVIVETQMVRVGEKSITFFQQIKDKNSGTLKSDCKTVLAGFNVETRESQAVPQTWKTIAEQHEGKSL